MINKKIVVNDLMQLDYSYYLTELMGENFHAEFIPALTLKQMLRMPG
jgi:hypothetical protein